MAQADPPTTSTSAIPPTTAPRGPFVTVGGAETNYPIGRYGGDAGKAVNAAGAMLKAAKGGTVYIQGGIGTTYLVSTQVVFYDTVNYIGDGITLRAAPGLVNPFTTDPQNAYYSGYIASMTLDGNNVSGTTVLTCISIQHCTFVDVVVANAYAPLTPIPPGNSPTIWKNPSATSPAYVQVYGGKVTDVTANGNSTGITAGVFYVAPSASVSIAWTSPPTINLSNGVGVLLTANGTITAPFQTRKQNCATNAFLSVSVRACSIGWILAGALTQGEITDNVFTESATQYSNVCAIAHVNNSDSNTWVQTQLQVNAPGAVAIAFNLLAPALDAQVYFNRYLACSIDTSNSASQIGVLLNTNLGKPNYILVFQSNAALPTPVAHNGRSRTMINDVVHSVKHVLYGKRSGAGWFAETYPGSDVPFTNPVPFSMVLFVQGGGISSIALNGLPLGMTGGLFPLKPGDALTCTSRGTPTTYASMLTDF